MPTTSRAIRARRWPSATLAVSYGNLAFAVLFLQFAMNHGRAFAATLKLSSLLMLIKVSTDTFFFLPRKMPKCVGISVDDWLVGFGGTYATFMTRSDNTNNDVWYGQALQVTGLCLQIAGILSLNRSFGLVAANRGVKTGGMYSVVRHPLYFSYTISFLGFCINNPSAWNVMIYCGSILLWMLRMDAEEKFLMQDPAYQTYAQKVRSRLWPGLL